MSLFLISQLLIAVAFFFDIVSFQLRGKTKVLYCLSAASLLVAIHFYLLDANTAAMAFVISSLRFLVSARVQATWLMYFFMALVIIATYLSYAGVLSLLAASSSLLSTWAAFKASDRVFRLVLMVCAVILIIHNVLAGTPAAVLLEIVFLISNVVAYYRYYWRLR